VDLPGHPAVTRVPASRLNPDSDLGDRLVTTDVAQLSPDDVKQALGRGHAFAAALMRDGLIHDAILSLQGDVQSVGTSNTPIFEGAHAHA